MNGDYNNDEQFVGAMARTKKWLEFLKINFYEVREVIRIDQLIFKEVNDLMLNQSRYK